LGNPDIADNLAPAGDQPETEKTNMILSSQRNPFTRPVATNMSQKAPNILHPNKRGDTHRRVLLLQFRNLGDAVILGGLAEALGRANPTVKIHILARPESIPIFRNNPFIAEVHSSVFPIVDIGKFINFGVFHLLLTILKMRLRGYSSAVNVFGDFRENLVGWLISSNGNTSLIWDVDNPNRNQIRTGLTFLVKNKIPVAANEISFYAAVNKLASRLDAKTPVRPHLYNSQNRPYNYVGGETIGLHLGASQSCRLWPKDKWRSLAKELCRLGHKVLVFGSPKERRMLEVIFGADDTGKIDILTGTFDDFFNHLATLKAIVCLDSFPAHAAYAVGTPTLIINGANMADIWRPPKATVVDGGGTMTCHPCFNDPTCEKGPGRYACIRNVEVEQVLLAIGWLCGL
jgi:ADP-heptose:LPS heptosyltransferase